MKNFVLPIALFSFVELLSFEFKLCIPDLIALKPMYNKVKLPMSFTKKNSVLLLRMSADTPSMENAPCTYVAVHNPKTLANAFFLPNLVALSMIRAIFGPGEMTKKNETMKKVSI